MVNLIQICASANDLFGLDSNGMVYRYNFNTNGWIRLAPAKYDGTRGAVEGPTYGRFDPEPAIREGA